MTRSLIPPVFVGSGWLVGGRTTTLLLLRYLDVAIPCCRALSSKDWTPAPPCLLALRVHRVTLSLLQRGFKAGRIIARLLTRRAREMVGGRLRSKRAGGLLLSARHSPTAGKRAVTTRRGGEVEAKLAFATPTAEFPCWCIHGDRMQSQPAATLPPWLSPIPFAWRWRHKTVSATIRASRPHLQSRVFGFSMPAPS